MNADSTKITVCGRLESGLELSHNTPSEAIYKGVLLVPRTSGTVDRVPVHIPGRLYTDAMNASDGIMAVSGVLRTYCTKAGNGSYTRVTMLASEVSKGGSDTPVNLVNITGTITREPVFRSTPLGREICDIMLAVNRGHGHIDYIPCIAWGGNARTASASYHVGGRLHVVGRFQSREYTKLLESGEAVTCTTYEISISKMKLCPVEKPDAEPVQEE